MKTHFVTCALLLTAAAPALAEQSTAELQTVRAPAPRIANPPPAPLVGGSDSCMTPDVLTGTGAFAFDNTNATTGAEGQSTVNCIFYNLIAVNNDVWFVWTAPQTGKVKITSCGLSSVDTKMSAYLYAGSCPAAGTTSLACNDDVHAYNFGLQSTLVFDVTAGQQILIQVGVYPGAPVAMPGVGQIDISYVTPASGCAIWDDGTTENALTVTPSVANGVRTSAWMHRYGKAGDVTSVTDISTAWGWTGTGTPLPAGLTVNVGLWDDPNDDGDPSDLVLLTQASAIISGQHTNAFQTIALPAPTNAIGVFFVGAWLNHSTGFPAPMDLTSCSVLDGDAWFLGDNTGNFQPGNLGANSYQPTKTGSLGAANIGVGFPWLLHASCSTGTSGTVFCPGDGTGAACPCGNDSPLGAGEGCLSSLAIGGKLRAIGVPSLSADSITLQGTQMPNSSCLYFQGTTQQAAGAGSAFGDGKRCAGGAVVRLRTKVNVAGASSYPEAGDPLVSVKGMVMAPGTRTYQAWYRNAAAFCTVNTFNLSNGLEVVWVP